MHIIISVWHIDILRSQSATMDSPFTGTWINIKLEGSIWGKYQWPNRVMPRFNFPPTLRELCKGQLGLDQWFWVGAYFLLIASQMFNFQVCSQCWEVSVEHGFTFCGNLSPLSLSIVNAYWKTFAPTQPSCTVIRIIFFWLLKICSAWMITGVW